MITRIVFSVLNLFFIGCISTYAQSIKSKPLQNQVSITLENDYFVFKNTDRYYTSGIFASYDKAMKPKKSTVLNKTFKIEVGQMIFKQFTRKVWPTVLVSNAYPGGIGVIDRPITGYLFGKYSQQIFYKKQIMLQWGASVGTIGPMSLGRQVQSGFHKTSGVGNWWDWVWDYQLRSEVGVNLHSKFAFSIFKNKRESILQVTPITQATLGTTFTDASQSLFLQIGKTNAMHQSGFWNSRIAEKATTKPIHKNEIFFYYLPTAKYQMYNATVQGGYFLNDKGPIVSDIKPWVISHKLGAMFANDKYSFDASVVYLSKEAETQFNDHAYGSIRFAYRF